MLEVLEAASLELSEASDWYEGCVTGLGDRFLEEIQRVFDFIAVHPALGSPWLLKGVPPGVRHVPLSTFPYSVVYVLEPRLVLTVGDRVVGCAGHQDQTDDEQRGKRERRHRPAATRRLPLDANAGRL